MGWSDKMEEDAELEEGEACYYKDDDDRSIDPDISLSYLDEKVQSVLGHLQKDFEGGISAENLGAKFGGYGSFLPTYQRSPSIWSQPKSSPRVQIQSAPKSPNHSCREGASQNSTAIPDAQFSKRNGTTAPLIRPSSLETKVLLGDGLLKKDSCLSSAQVTEKFPVRCQPSPNKLINPTDQRKLKFRIKVGSDKAAPKNAAIYSGLGLISPSSSTGNSPGESGGIPFESQETPDKSLGRILEMFTSITDVGGPLVSPLQDKFLNLRNSFMDVKPLLPLKVKHDHSGISTDDPGSRLGDGDALSRKQTKTVGKSEIHKESRAGNRVAFEDDITFRLKENSGAETPQNKQSISFDVTHKCLSDSLGNTGESSRDSSRVLDIVREPDNGDLIKKREVSKDKVKGRILGADLFEPFESVTGQGGIKVEHQEAKSGSVEKIGNNPTKGFRDISLDHSEGMRKKGSRIPASVKAGSDFSESDRDSKGAADHLVKKSDVRATSHEQDEFRAADSTKKFESKKKSKVSHVNGKLSSDLAQESRRTGSSFVAKEKKGIKKDVYKAHDMCKNMFETNSEPCGHPGDLLEKPSGDRSKGPKLDPVKDKHAYSDRFKEKSSHHKSDKQLNSAMLAKNPPTGSLPPTNGLALDTEQATVAPVLIEEDWVGCDRCQKWRLLPYGTKPEQLPEKWLCSMLNWLPGMNRCDISEEETTKALHSLYQLPLPENQNGAQYHAERIAPGVNSVDQFNHNYQNICSNYMANGRKKRHKLKEPSSKGSKASLVLTPVAKNFQQDMLKRGSLNDMKQPSPGVNPVNKSSGQHLSKSDNAVEKHSNRQKQERVTGGYANPKRKIKRESDQCGHGIAKKFKGDGAFDMDNSPASGGNLGRTGLGSSAILLTMAPVKEKQRSSESGYSKDAKSEEANSLQPCARKRADLVGSGSLDMKNYNDSEISAKKRSLKSWHNSPNNVEAVQNDGSYLNDNAMSVKEESSDSGFRRNKKPRASQNDGKDFSRNMSNDEQKRREMMTRPLSSGGKDKTTARGFDKEKQLKKYRKKVSSLLTMEDLESLKRDLSSEPLSTAATSSSSKVSDSRKTRANYQEVKGSPVDSVSSSPVRMSNPSKFSPMRMDSFGADDVRVGDFPITRSPRKVVDGDGNYDTKRSATVKKKKASDILHPESFNNPGLGFRETGDRDKFGGKSEAGLKPSLFGNGHLDHNHLDILDGHSPCPTDMHASESCYSKGMVSKNRHNNASLQKMSGKSSSLPPMDKGRAAGFSYEGTLGKDSDVLNNQGISNPKKTWKVEADIDHNHVAPCGEVSDDVKHPFPGRSGLKSVKNSKSVVKMDSRKWVDNARENQLKSREQEITSAKLGNPGSVDTRVQQSLNQGFQAEVVKNILTQVDCRDGNSQFDQHCKDKHDKPPASKLAPAKQNGGLLQIRPCDVSMSADVSRKSKDLGNAINQSESHHGMGHSAADCSVQDLIGPSLVKRDASGQTAYLALKEAEDLRDCADRLKNSGFGYECNEAYFQAALKFLHGASLLESNESSKHGEMNQMQIYINTAKLCETCAQEYEGRQEMAAAALAYKCMEVAYMRIVYCKNSSTSRLWHDLQTSLQMAPQGESPSSSASDIDNLNNQALVDKASLSKSNVPHTGNNIIAPRGRPNVARLLDFTKDVNSAMEASRKSQIAFSAANAILEEAQNKEGIISVKRVIDFSFQDVEELVRLVRGAIEAISRQGFSGSRD